MKQISAVVSMLVLFGASATLGAGLKLGDPAPMAATKMKNYDGKEVSIADVKGDKGTLVVFSCNGCPFAKAWEGRIVELGNAYRQKGIGAIMINSNEAMRQGGDSPEAIAKRAKASGFAFPYVIDADSEVAAAFGARVTPEAFLFDKAGQLVYHGTIDDNHKDPDQVAAHFLKDALEAVVAGKEIANKETKAIGCGIKFAKK